MNHLTGQVRPHTWKLLGLLGLLVIVLLVAQHFAGCGGESSALADQHDGRTPDADTVVPDLALDLAPEDIPVDLTVDLDAEQPDDLGLDTAPGDIPPEPVFDPFSLPQSELFEFGVSAYEPNDSSVLLWTRYTGDKPLQLLVFRQSASGHLIEKISEIEVQKPADEGIVQVEVDKLSPFTRYAYFFAELEDATRVSRSRLGRFYTAPAADDKPVITFAHTSCAKGSYQPFTVLSSAAKEDIAFFVFNGDIVYADDSKTLEDYRQHYRHNWGDDGLGNLRASTGFYHMLDDHEVDNNWDPEKIDPKQLERALTAYREYNPMRIVPEHPERLWRTYLWGKTLELIIIDSRTERRRSKDEYMSREQLAWLKKRLLESPAVFKFIVNTVPIAKFPINNRDGWSGYDKDRKDILGHIKNNSLKHVYWLSGDMHAAMVFDLGESWDLVASPIGQLKVGLWDFLDVLTDVKYINGNVNNYMMLTADPNSNPPRLTISIRDDAGKEIYTRTFE